MADSAAAAPPKASYSTDPALYIYTSLSSGSSHIVTATSRIETILRANRIPFKALDLATDEKARMLWGRRAGKDESGRVRKLPGLVQMGLVVGDLVEVEDWNEYGELKQHVTLYYDEFTIPSKPPPAFKITPSRAPVIQKENVKPVSATTAESSKPLAAEKKEEKKVESPIGGQATAFTLAMRQIGQEAAGKAKEIKKKVEPLVGLGTAGTKDENSTKPPAKDTEVKKEEPVKQSSTVDEIKKEQPAEVETVKATEPEKDDDDDEESDSDDSDSSSSSIHEINTIASLQSPTSTTRKPAHSIFPLAQTPSESKSPITPLKPIPSVLSPSSLQSPTSTAWKPFPAPAVVDDVVTTHRGSIVSQASPEEIRRIEEECAIPEEDEEDEEAVEVEEYEEEDDDDDNDEEDDDDDDDSDDDAKKNK